MYVFLLILFKNKFAVWKLISKFISKS